MSAGIGGKRVRDVAIFTLAPFRRRSHLWRMRRPFRLFALLGAMLVWAIVCLGLAGVSHGLF